MNAARAIIQHGTIQDYPPTADTTVFKTIRNAANPRNFLRFSEAMLAVHCTDFLVKPLLTILVLRAISRGRCFVVDDFDNRQQVTLPLIARLISRFVRDFVRKNALLRQTQQTVEGLNTDHETPRKLTLTGIPIYLRTDLVFGLRSGGSVGHIAGVFNNLDQFVGRPILLSTDFIPTVRGDLQTYRILPEKDFADFNELPHIFFNQRFEREAQSYIGNRKVAFIYQRYSAYNYCGVKLAQRYNVPFVLEYNGSEVWVGRNWQNKLPKYEPLLEEIELVNLRAADLIVVVSQPLKDELLRRGIEVDKILVNPNGVNPEKYSPKVDGSLIRRRYNLEDKTVIGFVGTFGPWHGAEVLAEAFGILLTEFPAYRDCIRLLLIGDGQKMVEVKNNLARCGVTDYCVLAGLVPQEQGASYLAACDILASPHVPNADGTPFFGSPTKLFEYMAMGKAIVASRLNQIGEVLEHDRTAWMIKPGDARDLAAGLKVLIDDKQRRERLGPAARQEVVARYTWREHTRKIIDKLKERCG